MKLFKTILVLIISILIHSKVNAQFKEKTTERDSLVSLESNQLYDSTSSDASYKYIDLELTKDEINRLLRAEFSEILTGQNAYSLGSYASLESKDSKVTFSSVLVTRNAFILTGTFSGKAADGSTSILDGGEFKQNFSGELRLHVLSNFTPPSYSYYEDDLVNVRTKAFEISQKYQAKRYELENDSLFRANRFTEQEKLQITLQTQLNIMDTLNVRINEVLALPEKDSTYLQQRNIPISADTLSAHYQRVLNTINNIQKAKSTTIPLDSMFRTLVFKKKKEAKDKLIPVEQKIEKLEKTEIFINNTFGSFREYYFAQRNVLELQEREEILKNRIEIIEPAGFGFGWFSVGLKATNSEFKLFDSNLPMEDQIINDDFISYELNGQYSHYWMRENDPDLFVSAGVTLSLTDNLDGLSSFKVNTITSYFPERSSTESVDVYPLQKYEDHITRLTLGTDIIYFFENRIDNGVRFKPSYVYGFGSENFLNLELSVLFPFRKKSDRSAAVTPEFFYSFNDLTQETKGSNELYKNNVLGLRFTLPINFKFNLYDPE